MRLHPSSEQLRTYLGICLSLLAACGSPAGPVEARDACVDAQALRSQIPGGSGFLSEAQEADIAAHVVPGGFGGLHQNYAAGTLIIHLTDLTKRVEAESTLRYILTCGAVYPGWVGTRIAPASITSVQGQFTATELMGWAQSLSGLRSNPGVFGVVIDPEINRIWIGLDQAAARVEIEQAVAGASVPLAAVTIESPPPSAPQAAFQILTSPVAFGETDGVYSFHLSVQYRNPTADNRYPDWCVEVFSNPLFAYFLYSVERWEGGAWSRVFDPFCELVALAPREVVPGEQVTDSVPVTAVHRVNAQPVWRKWRVVGTYRLVGRVYRVRTQTPPFVADEAPVEERVSAPFRLIR